MTPQVLGLSIHSCACPSGWADPETAAVSADDDLRQRRRILLTALTVLRFRYPDGAEPEMVRLLRSWLHGWPGIAASSPG